VSLLVGARAWNIGIAGAGGWQWKYYSDPASPIAAAPALFLCLLLAAGVAVCLRKGLAERRSEVIGVGLCAALSLGIILETAEAVPTPPYDACNSIVAPWAGGYYVEAVHVADMGKYLRGYADMIRQLRVNDPVRGHVADHPAGPVVFHWLVNRAMERWPAIARRFIPADADDVVGYDTQRRPISQRVVAESLAGQRLSDGQFAGIWASALLFRLGYWLALLLVYLSVREMHSREAGLLALALSALIPSLHLFSPYPDLLFPLFAVGAFYAWRRALCGGSAAWAALSGGILVLGLLWSLSLVATLALLAAYAALAAWEGAVTGEAQCRCGGWLRVTLGWAGGFAICSLLPTLLFGYDVYGVWRTCLSQHGSFAVLFPRPYWAWTLFNPVEFATFTGVPISILLAVVIVSDLQRWWPERRRGAPCALPWALLAVLAALNFSGKNLGEVARLWMFLMPFAAACAALMLAGLDGRRGWFAGLVLALAAVQLAVFRLSLDVFGF